MSANYFFEISPKSWEETKKLMKLLDGYMFRGHADKTWKLKTNIERAGEQHQQNPFNLYSFEKVIIEKFISRAHQYIQSPPNKDETFEWLSLLQDYGGPTRLLDFTDSFYIAAFFAVEFAEQDSCIWAIRENDLLVAFIHDENRVARRNSIPFKYAEELVTSSIHNTENLVFPLRPSRLNERVAIQKGLFLFPRNLSKSFETNLCSTLGFEFDTLSSRNSQKISIKELVKNHQDLPSVLKINLSHKWSNEVVYDLYSMNIDSASLFPGLDGFARSLRFVIKGDRFVPGG